MCFCVVVAVHSAASNDHHSLRCETYTCFGLPLERLNMKESVRADQKLCFRAFIFLESSVCMAMPKLRQLINGTG